MMANKDDSTLSGRIFDRPRPRLARNDGPGGVTQPELAFLATGLGLTSAEFRTVATRAGDPSARMEEMMRVRGLDPDQVRQTFGGLMRQTEIFCAKCQSGGRCQCELDSFGSCRRLMTCLTSRKQRVLAA